jgi:hypothetical protein
MKKYEQLEAGEINLYWDDIPVEGYDTVLFAGVDMEDFIYNTLLLKATWNPGDHFLIYMDMF